jgi:membrane protein DedA with SNARE-associated domain
MLVAAIASTLGDQAYFHIAGAGAARCLDRLPPLARRAPQVRALITRYHKALVLGIRLMIGLRIAGPMLMGWARVDPWRFTLLNAVGAALWAVLVAGAGYGLGNAWASLADHPQGRVLLILFVAGAGRSRRLSLAARLCRSRALRSLHRPKRAPAAAIPERSPSAWAGAAPVARAVPERFANGEATSWTNRVTS